MRQHTGCAAITRECALLHVDIPSPLHHALLQASLQAAMPRNLTICWVITLMYGSLALMPAAPQNAVEQIPLGVYMIRGDNM